MDYRDQIDELLARAEALGHGMGQYALTDEAVRLADSHNDIKAGFHTRLEYIKATMFSGQPDKMLVAFSWCLAQVDADPQRFDLYRLLWQYKWVIGSLPDFPQIERHQIAEMFADMERRFLAYGATPQAVWNKRRGVAIHMGDQESARNAHQMMATLKRDGLSDCLACEMDEAVTYYHFMGDDQTALEKARPILRDRYSCSEVPHTTFAQVLLPLLRLGRGSEAMPYHIRGYRMIAKNPAKFIKQIAEHIKFLALTGNYPRGLRLMEKHLNLGLETCCPAWTFDIYLAMKLLMERLAEAGMVTIRVRTPATFPARTESGEYEVNALRDWFTQQAAELADRFDRRNGNDYHRRRLHESDTLKRYAINLKVPTRTES